MRSSLLCTALLMGFCFPAMAQQESQGGSIPGDAYWEGASMGQQASQAGSEVSIPGDAYWGNTGVDPMVPMNRQPQSVDDVLSSRILNDRRQRDEIPWLRAQVIQEGAAAFGAQAGMAARAVQLNEELNRNAHMYDRIFNFSAIMLEPGFLPPVISEGRDAYKQPSDFQVRAADRIYKIEFPARLVSVPPRWQDYLYVSQSAALPPDRTALPKNKAEQALWDQWAASGWNQGVALAEDTFRSNMGRLKRDFEGMLRYKTLYTQGLVEKPILARSALGVTGGGNEMALGDRIYEVTGHAALNPDQSKWITPSPRTHVSDPPVYSESSEKDR